MKTDEVIEEMVDAMANNMRERHVMREMLLCLVRVALAEQRESMEQRLLDQIHQSHTGRLLQQLH